MSQFDAQIAADTVPDTHQMFDAMKDFTCSTVTEVVAGQIALMHICQSYYSYDMKTMCGIPEFVLAAGAVAVMFKAGAVAVISSKTLPALSEKGAPCARTR